jgi:hypothetical protein
MRRNGAGKVRQSMKLRTRRYREHTARSKKVVMGWIVKGVQIPFQT